MDGLSRALAARTPITLSVATGGTRTYLLKPITLGVIGSIESYLLSQRGTPVQMVERNLQEAPQPESVAQQLLRLAYADLRNNKASRMVRLEEIQDWINTRLGLAQTAWHCLGDCGHPSFVSPQEAAAYFARYPDEIANFVRLRDQASGLDLLANLDWPEPREQRKGTPRFVPWKRILRDLAREYHWSPEQVAGLTLYQLKLYTAEETELGGTVQMTAEEYTAYRQQK